MGSAVATIDRSPTFFCEVVYVTDKQLHAVRAEQPEDLTRLFVQFANDGDAEALAGLYEADAVVGFPPGQQTVGRAAIRALYDQMLASKPKFKQETPLPTLRVGDLALTGTQSSDGTGGRVQVVRRQADGRWLRIIDRPENPGVAGQARP